MGRSVGRSGIDGWIIQDFFLSRQVSNDKRYQISSDELLTGQTGVFVV